MSQKYRDFRSEVGQALVTMDSTQAYNVTHSHSSSYINFTFPLDQDTEDGPHKEFYEKARFVTGLICYPIMCIFGMTGNIFILIVLAQKSMRTSTNVFLSALAVSDFLKLVNDSLYFLTILLLETNEAAGNKCYGYLYPYAHFVFNISTCVSSWLTISVAIERYVLVCHPTLSKTWTSIPRSQWISTACFVVMTAVAIPSALRYRTVELPEVRNGTNVTVLDVELTDLWKDNTTFVTAYNWVQGLLRSMIPLVILVISSSAIINALRKTRANKKMASRNKITTMLIIVIFFFLICITPDAVMSGFFNLGYAESDNNLVKGVREITDMLLGVNAAINFTLYMIFNKIFRDQFVSLFCGRCRSETQRSALLDTKYSQLEEKNVNGDSTKSRNNNLTSAL